MLKKDARVMERLEILVAGKCDLNCRDSSAHGGGHDCEDQVLAPEQAKKYLRALFLERYISVDAVVLFGGEPAIVPHTIQTICEFLERYSTLGLLEKMPVFTLVTNGTLIDEGLAQTIKKYDIRVKDSDTAPVRLPLLPLHRGSQRKSVYGQPYGAGYEGPVVLTPNGELYPCHYVGDPKYLLSRFDGRGFDFSC